MSEERFCSRCGSTLEVQWLEGRQRQACPRCTMVLYLNPKLVAAGVVLHQGRVLLVQRAAEPGRGLWALPAGYVDRGEVVEEAAAREVQEETGLRVRVLGLVGLFSRRDDPVVLAVYAMEAPTDALSPNQETLDARWFTPDTLPPLAFARDATVIQQCLHAFPALLRR